MEVRGNLQIQLTLIAGMEELMAELKCAAVNCTYNKEKLCSKGDIMVGGKHADDTKGTFCDSFAKRREGQDAYTSSIDHPSRVISIDCEAVKCMYNNNYKCVAEHVDIQGNKAVESKETACGTFKEK